MIYSRLHRFLFIKGRKVAGTSCEVALSQICGPDDILTPITPIDEQARLREGCRHAQNYGADPGKLEAYIAALRHATPGAPLPPGPPPGPLKPHTSLQDAYTQLGDEITNARIIAIARSPYQTVLSWLNHRLGFNHYKATGAAMASSREALKRELPIFLEDLRAGKHRRNINSYQAPAGATLKPVDYLRFETLQQDLDRFLASLGLDQGIRLPHLKKGQNLSDDVILEIASAEQVAEINATYQDEFDAFGYPMLAPGPHA